MKIGLLIAQFNEIEFLADCLRPWIQYRQENPDNLVISCLDVKFAENESKETKSTDGSYEYLQNCYERDYIDHFANPVGNLKEHDARNVGLKWLLAQNIDYHLTWGSDEVIKPEQIPLIYQAAEKDPFAVWFRINYKNFVFDKQHYILGFNPARLFKVNCGDWKLDSYCWDDDVFYRNNRSEKTSGMGQESDILRPHTGFACKTIPNLLVDHYTWLNGPRSVAKIDYQRKHFGHCSYTYNEKGEISFDLDYYRRNNNSPLPEVYTV